LVGEHAVLLRRLELEQRATRQTHLVTGKRHGTRDPSRAGELDASLYVGATQEVAQPTADRRAIERRTPTESRDGSRVAEREPEKARACRRQPEYDEPCGPMRARRPHND